MKSILKILYVGSLEKQSNSRKRFQTLQKMGHEVEGIDVDPYIFVPFWLRFHYHLFFGPGIQSLNKEVLKKVDSFQPDVLWVDNKPYLQSGTLNKIRQMLPDIKLANIITDDPCGRYAYCWRRVYHTFKSYDIQFVQREVNVHELLRLGSRRVEICYRSFDPGFHRPLPEIQSLRKESDPVVGFIGSFEEDREEYIAYLVQNGIQVEITGNDWPKGKYWHLLKPFYKGPSVFGESYIETINRMDIALHFLRKANRDQQDSRTFEIPACGVFMLAERSHLHQELFRENKECDFFTTKEELLNKVRYYLRQPEKRAQFAKAALDRSYESGYDHTSRLKYVLESISAPPPPPRKFDRIVTGIYYDPDFYPPTINAVLNLSRICNELVVVTRNNNLTDFPYPSNVKLVKSGPYMTVQESEQKSTLFKVLSFLRFTFHLWKYSQSNRTGLVVYYDAMPLLSYFITRYISTGRPIRWYHNHDMPGTHPLRKYSIGWLSQQYEHKAMDQMDHFTLPSSDRLAFYPNWNRPDRYFTIPNYPSIHVYTNDEKEIDASAAIRVIYQGTIGEQLALEAMMELMRQHSFIRPLTLVMKGGVREAYKNKLLELARQSGVENDLEWHGLGPYRELPAVTASCHVGLAVYMGTDNVRKTLGTASNKIYEYAACGLPVILYDNEQFRKYLSGYPWAFFSNGTPASLKECLSAIMENYAALSQKARESFEQELNFENAFSTFMNRLETR